MPYRFASYYVIVCIAVILAGFWQSYFSVWGEVPWQFHAHGVAASVWVLMVLAQSWTPHHGQLAIHRVVGKSSLLLFPFLIGLALAVGAYVTLYYRALKYRRKVWVHSGYMLATPLILLESPLSRVFTTWVPGLTIQGPQDFGRLMPVIVLAMAVELVVIAAIWFAYRDKARPFLVAGLFIVAQMLTMGLLSDNALLEGLLVLIAPVSSPIVVLTGMAIGAATSWAGWQAGKRSVVPPTGAAQPA